MKPWIFLGPTLRVDHAREILDATYLPPVGQGDVLRALQHSPKVIGIVDGLFDQSPAVWHKEILWALTQGVAVYGSASMGALRAAELHPYGMIGIGRIFEDFRAGRLEDDDEVALAHGPAAWKYAPLSEPMVNIRATLLAAEANGTISRKTQDGLVSVAKKLFYPDREWAAILEQGRALNLSAGELDALDSALPEARVDQKAADAIEMLERIRDEIEQDRRSTPFNFNATTLWEEARRRAGATSIAPDGSVETLYDEEILDELRLSGSAWTQLYDRSVVGLCLAAEARRAGMKVDEADLVAAMTRFRVDRGLFAPEALDQWMSGNGLTADFLVSAISRQVMTRAAERLVRPAILAEILTQTRLAGIYGALQARSADKRRQLISRALDGDGGRFDNEGLLNWYTEETSQGERSSDAEACARKLGCASSGALFRMLRREWHYRELGAPPAKFDAAPGLAGF